jgi:hypothetical protein
MSLPLHRRDPGNRLGHERQGFPEHSELICFDPIFHFLLLPRCFRLDTLLRSWHRSVRIGRGVPVGWRCYERCQSRGAVSTIRGGLVIVVARAIFLLLINAIAITVGIFAYRRTHFYLSWLVMDGRRQKPHAPDFLTATSASP